MKPLRWRNLTKKQQSEFGNGCGAKNMAKWLPQVFFKASCNQHDFYYWRGGEEQDRRVADTFFYAFMIEDIKKKPAENNTPMFILNFLAWAYFAAVRLFGWLFFERGQYKTKEDLKQYFKEKKQ